MEVAWTTGECCVRQRTTVHGRVGKEIEQNAEDRDKIVNSIPPTDRWADRTNKPRVRTVLKALCGSQAERLAGVVGISRVYSEQQGLHSNKGFAFHGKLRERIKNGQRYKKERKDRKSNGVCGENKEDT